MKELALPLGYIGVGTIFFSFGGEGRGGGGGTSLIDDKHSGDCERRGKIRLSCTQVYSSPFGWRGTLTEEHYRQVQLGGGGMPLCRCMHSES